MTTKVAIRRTALMTLAMALLGSEMALAQTTSPVIAINAEAARSDVNEQPLRRNVHLLVGSGGNISVLVDSSGSLMVDAGIAVSQGKIQSVLVRIGASRVKYLVNTHWHWDHTDGNEWVQALGATIFAHPNTLRHMSHSSRVEEWSYTFAAWPPRARPTALVENSRSLKLGDEVIVIRYLGPAHTDGDLSMRFTKADVLALGDGWWNGMYPFIDVGHGGSIDGMIRVANESIAAVTDTTLIVPGHGPAGGRSDLIEYRDMLSSIRAKVARLKAQGMSLDEVIASKPTAAFDEKWGKFVIDPAFFTRLVYTSLK